MPKEYAEMTIERAMWQSFGRRMDDMTFEEYELKVMMLHLESENAKKKKR